jgi:hypothetical protein
LQFRFLTAFSVPLVALSLAVGLLTSSAPLQAARPEFERIATYTATEVAEIVAATDDGNTLVYTDSASEEVGVVDISDPSSPRRAATIPTPGEPTSVAVRGPWALISVSGDEDVLLVYDLNWLDDGPRATLPLGGQPDSVAVSPDGAYAAVVIENERDEEVDDGAMPQLPGGFLTVVDLDGPPEAWTTRDFPSRGWQAASATTRSPNTRPSTTRTWPL